MNAYEIVVIFHPELSEDQVNQAVGKLESIIKKDAGEVVSVNNWGRKKFCYPIKKQSEGIYAVVVFKTGPANIEEMQSMLKVESSVLRFLIVKMIERKPKPVKEKKSKIETKAEGAPTAAAPAKPE